MNSYTELFTHIKSIVKTMKAVSLVIVVSLCVRAFAATPQVKNVKAMQQYPWGKVYISYEVEGDVASSAGSGKAPFLLVTAKDKTSGRVYEATHLTGDTGTSTGLHKVIWDVATQGVTINSANMVFTVAYCDELYLVVDLSSGANSSFYSISHLYAVPSGGWTDTYKTTKLVLRGIPAGTFKMQNTSNVTLTKPFYMGVFEVTQKQYQLVMGSNPSGYTGDKRPVESVSYNTIRGSSNGAKWPSSSAVDSTSFMGKLRVRTGLNFDLPTEAQWEYACRAGTTSSYNNGGNTVNDLKLLGRYSGNTSDGKGGYSTHTTVGSYLPNAWGLYDMHGNVYELCLDWYGALSYGTDPKGCASATQRSNRSGGYLDDASGCTSQRRDDYPPDSSHPLVGFRLVRTL